MISCGPIERKDKGDPLWVSRKLAERKLLIQDALRVQVRTSVEEMETTAKEVAERLNKYPSKKLVKFIIPQKGFSSLSVKGGALHDPLSDKAFTDGLKKNLDTDIQIIEVDTHINTFEFTHAVVEALEESLKAKAEKTVR
jgi:uncharacterized protein (UPF0261 family)